MRFCLQGTVSAQKNEILHARFGINYNNLDAMYRRGSILLWEAQSATDAGGATAAAGKNNVSEARRDFKKEAARLIAPASHQVANAKTRRTLRIVHEDMLKDRWWTEARLSILSLPS